MTEQELLKLGFKYLGKNKDMYYKGCILHRRKRGWVINKRAPIIDSLDKLEGYFKYALNKQLN
jgi:hypothetical protein